MKRILLPMLCATIILLFVGCGGSGSTTRFRVHTQYRVNWQPYDEGGVITDATCSDCFLWGYTGPLKTNFSLGYTDSHGWRTFEGGYLPANWNLARYQSARCPVYVINTPAYLAQDVSVPLFCDQQPYWYSTPNSINAYSPPSTIGMNGEPVVSTTYGTPKVDFYNESGYLIGSIRASSASPSSATINTPGFLLAQYSGSYVAIISNINSDQSSTAVAATAIDIYNNDPPPPPDPCYLYAVGSTALSDEEPNSVITPDRPIDPCL